MLIKNYSDLCINTPECLSGSAVLSARFKLDADVAHLFPFINAVTEDAVYFENPIYIKFTLDGFLCAMYTDSVSIVPFGDREQALNFIKRLIDFLNDLDSRKNSIEPDHKRYRHIPVLEVFKLLPRTNCRECGSPTCMAFADALSKGETSLEECPELGNYNNENVARLQLMLS